MTLQKILIDPADLPEARFFLWKWRQGFVSQQEMISRGINQSSELVLMLNEDISFHQAFATQPAISGVRTAVALLRTLDRLCDRHGAIVRFA